MPASNLSRYSIPGMPKSDSAAHVAKSLALKQIAEKLRRNELNKDDGQAVSREYKIIYEREYYREYCNLQRQQQFQTRIVYVPTDNPAATKFFSPHTVVNFSKSNLFIQVHRDSDCITIGTYNYPLDDEVSPETKEVFIPAWPGPLDRSFDTIKFDSLTGYVDILLQNHTQRCISYMDACKEEQRKTILKLFRKLLMRNGRIDAAGITELLLDQEQYEISRDEGNKDCLGTLQKYLLLGQRSTAIRFAKSKKLWDHAHCLGFLERYQPPAKLQVEEGLRLKDDPIVQLNEEYINSLANEAGVLSIVYRALLNRVLKSDPEALNAKPINVAANAYNFAMLCANDCEMDFDQSNEIFKLIVAIKSAMSKTITESHLISLGFVHIDQNDITDNISHLSFKPVDTYHTRTLTISNIDMLILNEVWEYCLNLAKGTCNAKDYEYIINLVPHKLIFASRLLDFGQLDMFANYLNSIRNALYKAKCNPDTVYRDPFYDWDTIENCVEHLSRIWDFYIREPITTLNPVFSPVAVEVPQTHNFHYDNTAPVTSYQPSYVPNHSASNDMAADYVDGSHNHNHESLPYQGEFNYQPVSYNFPPQVKHDIPPPIFNQSPIQEEADDYESGYPRPLDNNQNPYEPQPYNDYSNGPSRRQSASQGIDVPVFSPPGAASQDRPQKTMKSSSPVNKDKDPMQSMGESFNSPYSPINRFDDLQRRDSDYDARTANVVPKIDHGGPVASSSRAFDGPSQNSNGPSAGLAQHNGQGAKALPAGDQQAGFFTSLVGSAKALLPKSNSKQMILPDDSKKSFVYNEEKGSWVDTNKSEGAHDADDLDDAPPMLNITKPPSYQLAAKTAKSRYPKSNFG